MALYPYVATLTVDPATMTKATGATGAIYAPEDTAFASPLQATDPNGNQVLLTSNTDGILPTFYTPLPAVNWVSGSYVFPLVTSQPVPGGKGEDGAPGRDGSNVVPTATAISYEIVTPGTDSNAFLTTTYAKRDNPVFTGAPTGIVKAHVGLDKVDNTADSAKPVSTLQRDAIDARRLGDVEAPFDAKNMAAPVGTKITVPTHISPAGGQTVHPSVLFFPEKWGGYHYWMAHTPYPGGNDDHEDPNIAASQDGITWVVPAGLTNPIDDADGTPEYNSDVDLKMGPNNTMYLFWRWYANVANGGTEERLKFSTSTDGINWSAPTIFYQQNQTVRRLLSPSLVFEDGAWTMFAVDVVTATNTVVRLRSANSSPASTWSTPTTVNVGPMQTGKSPWHIFVLKFGGTYYGLLNDCTTDTGGSSGDILLMTSIDGLTWTNSGTPVIPKAQAGEHDQLYRSTMVPAYQDGRLGFRVWYSGWTSTGPVWNIYRTFLGAGAWKPLTLAGAWLAYVGGGGYRGGLFYKKVGSEVTIEGTIKSGAAGSEITTLPAGISPVGTFMAPVNVAGTLGQLQIFADSKTGAADDRKIKFFQGSAAPAYMPISVKFEAQ